MHVKTPQDHEHNVGNKTLLEGARRLGYLCKSVPQNITGTFAAHQECGASCTAGCRGRGEADDEKTGRSGKMSGERAFLDEFLNLNSESPDVARKKITVDILDKFDVERIVFEEVVGAGRKAVGAMGTVKANDGTVHKAFIKANRVVVAAGTLNSPCVLLRSGLKVSSKPRQSENLTNVLPWIEPPNRQKPLLAPDMHRSIRVGRRGSTLGGQHLDDRHQRILGSRRSRTRCQAGRDEHVAGNQPVVYSLAFRSTVQAANASLPQNPRTYCPLPRKGTREGPHRPSDRQAPDRLCTLGARQETYPRRYCRNVQGLVYDGSERDLDCDSGSAYMAAKQPSDRDRAIRSRQTAVKRWMGLGCPILGILGCYQDPWSTFGCGDIRIRASNGHLSHGKLVVTQRSRSTWSCMGMSRTLRGGC